MAKPFGADIDLDLISGRPDGRTAQIRAAIVDGTFAFGIGSALVAAFGPAAIQSLIDSDRRDLWWHLLLTAAGITIFGLGLALRGRAKRATRVAVIAVAQVAHWSRERLQSQIDDATRHFRDADVIIKVHCVLPDAPDAAGAAIDQMTEKVRFAMSFGARLHPDASAINLVPLMPLHAAFRFGAGLSPTHSVPVVICAPMQRAGARAAYVPIPLQVSGLSAPAQPMPIQPSGESRIDGVGGDRIALAVNLQNFDEQKFLDRVREQCTADGYARLVSHHSESPLLDATPAAATAQVAAIVARLRSVHSTDRNRAIFLTGPPGISVVLGARLASQEIRLWTAYSFDQTNDRYVRMAPPAGAA